MDDPTPLLGADVYMLLVVAEFLVALLVVCVSSCCYSLYCLVLLFFSLLFILLLVATLFRVFFLFSRCLAQCGSFFFWLLCLASALCLLLHRLPLLPSPLHSPLLGCAQNHLPVCLLLGAGHLPLPCGGQHW